jgi:hypothetical protein
MKKALVLAIVCAFGFGAAGFAQGALSGSWETSICIDPQAPAFTGFDSVLTIDYTVSGWTFESVSTFDITGWVGQEFNVDGVLGAFTIGSAIVFDPQAASFTYWYNDATVNIAGVALEFQTILNATGFGMVVGVSGGAADLTFAADLYLNAYDNAPLAPPILPYAGWCFCFNEITLELTFPFCCIELVEVSLGFSQAGFDGITFSVTDITFPNLPWMVWDLDLTFVTGTGVAKILTITPGLDLGDFACFTVYADLCVLEDCYTGVNIYGIGLECDFNGCTFSTLSYLDYPTHHIHGGGTATYWERFCIECGGDSCCGGAFSFEVCIYFSETSLLLFDFGEADINLAFGISSNFDLTTALVVDATGFVSWCIGFNVTW